jgi:hypothetical protein
VLTLSQLTNQFSPLGPTDYFPSNRSPTIRFNINILLNHRQADGEGKEAAKDQGEGTTEEATS